MPNGTTPSKTQRDRAVRIAVANLTPFALWLRRAATPAGQPIPPLAITRDDVRIDGVDAAAEAAGVTAGMTIAGARQRLPSLDVVPAAGPGIDAAWEAHLDALLDLSPRIEPLDVGIVALQADAQDAHHLAETHGARVGFADTIETAWLATLLTQPGEVWALPTGDDPWKRLDPMPLHHLHAVGLPRLDVERLTWLGVTTLGALRRWKPRHLAAYLGPASETLIPFLHGPHRTRVSRRPPPVIEMAMHEFDDSVHEPAEIDPILTKLVREASDALAGRSAQRVRVVVHGAGVRSEGTRRAKAPLRDATRLEHLAQLALADAGLVPLGIDTLRIELSGLSRPSEAGELWPQRQRRERARHVVAARFPGQARQFVSFDPHALRNRLRWQLEGAETTAKPEAGPWPEEPQSTSVVSST